MWLIVAVAAAAMVAWLLLPECGQFGPARPALAGPPIEADETTPLGASRRRPLGVSAVVVAGGVVAMPMIRPAPHLLLVAIVAAGAAVAGVALLRRARGRARRATRRREVVDLCDGLVAELRAGQPPSRALAWLTRTWPELERTTALARMGGDVPAALRRVAAHPGAEPFGQIAAGWQVAQRSGASLADVLDRLSRSLRDDEDVRREVTASLGPTRATARLLAVLPLFGLGLGVTMGADPLSVLVGSTIGSICLATGAALAIAGLFWVERIADRADPW
jgi:tight adherence protein B